MFAYSMAGPGRAVVLALALIVWAPSVEAQQQPSANAMSIAKEVVEVKGVTHMYDLIVPGVIERAKGMFLQTNPMLGKDLNEVTAKLRADYASRTAEVRGIVIKAFAARFSEQELKDVLAFYKTAAGKKLVAQEPKIAEESMMAANAWAEKFSEEIIPKIRAEMRKRGHEI